MPKLVLVEDDLSIRKLFTLLIKAEGWELQAFEEGEPALEYLSENGVDAVILDVWLPDLSGLEVAKRLREQSVEAPILLVTAGSLEQLQDSVASLPNTIIRDKWLTPDDLRHLLRTVLKNKAFA